MYVMINNVNYTENIQNFSNFSINLVRGSEASTCNFTMTPEYGDTPTTFRWLNLQGYWKFDESSYDGTTDEVTDSSDNTNDGTTAGTPSVTTGKLGNCIDFDGSDDKVTIDDNSTIRSIESGISIAYWLDLDAYDASYTPIIVKGVVETCQYCVNFDSSDKFQFQYYGTDGTLHTWTSTSAYTGDTSTDFHHWVIVFTYNTGSSIVVYRDGSTVAGSWTSGDGNSYVKVNTSDITIGTLNIGSTDYWLNGKLDDVSLWNTVLTASQVSDLYNSGTGLEIDVDEFVDSTGSVPIADDEIIVWDSSNRNKKLFGGYITNPEPVVVTRNHDADAYVKEWKIQCIDYRYLVDRIPVNEVYSSKTRNFILVDIIKRYSNSIDTSLIDTTQGTEHDSYRSNDRKGSALFDELCDYDNVVWWVDPYKRLHVGDKNDNMVGWELTDDNIEGLVTGTGKGRFKPIENTKQIVNEVKVHFKARYNSVAGESVAVTLNSKIVTGTNTSFTRWAAPGTRFWVDSEEKYTIQSVDSDTQVTLSSTFNSSSDSGLAFVVSGLQLVITNRSDTSTYGRRSEAVKINSEITYEQAKVYGDAYIRAHSGVIKGFSLKTNTKSIDDLLTSGYPWVEAGQSINTDLSTIYSISGVYEITSVNVRFTGGTIQSGSNAGFPMCELELSTKSRVLDWNNFVRQIARDAREVGMSGEELVVSSFLFDEDIIVTEDSNEFVEEHVGGTFTYGSDSSEGEYGRSQYS